MFLSKLTMSPLQALTTSETTSFPHSLTPYLVYSGCLINALLVFMKMCGLQLMAVTTAQEKWWLTHHPGPSS